jgi:hypothetical protein
MKGFGFLYDISWDGVFCFERQDTTTLVRPSFFQGSAGCNVSLGGYGMIMLDYFG